jgi:3-methyladenine DNA glycosylase/8-oxoguanine DNA glycosylase
VSRLRFNWAEAKRHLRSSCAPLRVFIDDFGAARYPVRKGQDLFQALARSIAYQQLSGKAAGTIHGRFEQLFANDRPNAVEALELGFTPLRGAGLSNSKTLSILDLAEKQLAGQLPTPRKLAGMSDGQIIESLCQVRGIGPWTAQMHLIFYLGRPDVMPATDLGVQKGVRNVYGLQELPAPDDLMQRTHHLAPYRSAAAWYFWRASETVTP